MNKRKFILDDHNHPFFLGQDLYYYFGNIWHLFIPKDNLGHLFETSYLYFQVTGIKI